MQPAEGPRLEVLPVAGLPVGVGEQARRRVARGPRRQGGQDLAHPGLGLGRAPEIPDDPRLPGDRVLREGPAPNAGLKEHQLGRLGRARRHLHPGFPDVHRSLTRGLRPA